MRTALLAALVAAGVGSVATQWHDGDCCGGCDDSSASMAEQTQPFGQYLDVRNATVFGGACHVNGEVLSQGELALMVWSFEGGSHAGVDLSGVRMAAAVEGASNLATGAERRSSVWIDAATEEARAAAATWAQVAQRGALGEVQEVHASPVTFDSAQGFVVSVPDVLKLDCSALPDDACCTMPESRWYTPLAHGLTRSKVGFTDVARFEGTANLISWSYSGANTALYGAFSHGADPRPEGCGLDGIVAESCCGDAD